MTRGGIKIANDENKILYYSPEGGDSSLIEPQNFSNSFLVEVLKLDSFISHENSYKISFSQRLEHDRVVRCDQGNESPQATLRRHTHRLISLPCGSIGRRLCQA